MYEVPSLTANGEGASAPFFLFLSCFGFFFSLLLRICPFAMVTSRSGDWIGEWRSVANPPAKRYMSREGNRGERGRAVSVLQSKRRGGARLRANAATPRWAPRKPLR